MLLRSQSEVNMFKSVFFCVVSEWLIRIMYKYVYYSEADLILYVWRLFFILLYKYIFGCGHETLLYLVQSLKSCAVFCEIFRYFVKSYTSVN